MRVSHGLTVSTVCLRQYSLSDALAVAQDLGFDAVDLVGLRGLCEHVPVNGTVEDMRRAAEQVRASGMRAASVNADPGSYDGADDPGEVDRRVDLLLDFMEDTATPLLVLPAGEKTADRQDAPRTEQMIERVNGAGERARRRGIRLAVEAPYFGRPVDTLDRAAALFDRLDPAIELAFDVSHVEAADESITAGWARFADRVGIVHLRDAVSGDIRRVIGRGRVEFAGLFSSMSASGYAGDVVLELETRDSPYASKEEEVRAAVAYLEPLRR